jgi:predicted O-methyltransferase YrrM
LIAEVLTLRRLPVAVARFHVRARRAARRAGDKFSLESATRADELAKILELAGNHRHVAEIGTGTAWTAIALALSDRDRRVMTLDPIPRPERQLYLDLVPSSVRLRIELLERAGEQGPPPSAPSNVGFLFIDSSHERDETIATFSTWRDSLAPGAAVAFHDYDEPAYPGVTEAVDELGLDGEVFGHLFIWRNEPSPAV